MLSSDNRLANHVPRAVDAGHATLRGAEAVQGIALNTAVKSPRNASVSKAKILDAAIDCFSQLGYAGAGIREIAENAGVSYALLQRYFGSKIGLFEAALNDSLDSSTFLDVAREEFGRNLAHRLTQPGQSKRLTAMVVLAAADPEARGVATRIVYGKVVEALAEWLGPPDPRQRAIEIVMLGAGFVTHLHLLPLAGQEDISAEGPLAQWLADTIQRVVDRK